MTPLLRAVAVTLVLLAQTACSEATPELTPSPTDAFRVPQGAGASGPVEQIGGGDALDSAWRYGLHETDDGPCLQLELDGRLTVRCDDLVPAGEAALGSVGVTTSESTGVTLVEGVASTEVATVWIIAADQRRSLALLIPLTEWEVDGQAFVGAVAGSARPTHVQALALNGEVLETRELP